jgi:hypothetical protein
MTVSAATLGIGQFTGECGHAIVCAVLCGCLAVPGMTANAIDGGECMCRAKPFLFVGMTKQAGVFCLRLGARHELQRREYNGEQAEL